MGDYYCRDATQPRDGSVMSIVVSQQEVDVSQSRRQRSIPRWYVTPMPWMGTPRLAKRAGATTCVPPRAWCDGAVVGCQKYSEKCSVSTLLIKSQHGCEGVTLKGLIMIWFFSIHLGKEQSWYKAPLMALAASVLCISVGGGALRQNHTSGRKEMVFLIYKGLQGTVGG